MEKEIIRWEPDNFIPQLNTVWDFPNYGYWATHNSNFRGNFSPYIPRNLILRYTNENDLILDQFAGGGTTLIEAKLLNRNAIGIDINEVHIGYCKDKTKFKYNNKSKVYIRKGDATELTFIPNEKIDFICTHPPYANIIKYSKDIIGDLSGLSIPEFLHSMKKVAKESYRVLRRGKYCAILMGDVRENGYIKPLSYEVMNIFLAQGFNLKEIIIKKQHNCKMTDKWKNISVRQNFLLIAHEHLFVLKKD